MRHLVILLPLLLAGCTNIPASLSPLCTEAQTFHDDSIVGTYRLVQRKPPEGWQPLVTDGGADVVTVTISQEPSRYQVVLQHEQKKPLPFTCKLTKIGKHLYMDLQRPPLEDGTLESLTLRQHFLVRCTITDEGLRLSGCHPKRFRAKLEELGLPVVEVEAYAVFAGTTAQLRDVISEHGEQLLPLTEKDPWLIPATATAPPPTKSGSRESITLKSVPFAFRWCPPGDFLMGSPEAAKRQYADSFVPQHPVSISHGFWLQETEVTQAQYEMVTGETPSFWRERDGRKDAHPVESVSWNDAVRFCEALSKLDADHEYRLPTEAEWEYACRAGQPECRYGEINEIAWVFENTDEGHGSSGHRPVGQKKPNRWGLHDMFGNVAEWCLDWSAPAASIATIDPTGPRTGTSRVVRGGDCFADPGELRSDGACLAGSRRAWWPEERRRTVGFRVVQIHRPSKDQPSN